ncbi:MAG: hypothetical protein AAF705_03145 [Bacteroidota bacterium]
MTKLQVLTLGVCLSLYGCVGYPKAYQAAQISKMGQTPKSLPQQSRYPSNVDNLLRNGSFEGTPRASTVPEEWINWGPSKESPPDIHPTGAFGVTTRAKNGNTYLGMVVRDNNTWEGIAQKLDQPLQVGQLYKLTGYAARSETYNSMSRQTNERASFSHPAILRVSGNDQFDHKIAYPLSQSLPILNMEWLYFEMILKPEADLEYLILEVYYDHNVGEFYNGNILLDDLKLVKL